MALTHDKKGIEADTLIEMILTVMAIIIIGYFIYVFTANAEEKTSENICQKSNAIRFGSEKKTGITIGPRACKTIDKREDIPSKNYQVVKSPVEGAKAEIRDLMARCWWMWLEGNQKNMFDEGLFEFDEKCFVCYTFSIDKDTGYISYNDFVQSLDEPYYALDTTDRCAPGGQGGECRESCSTESEYFSKEIASDRCENDFKCCVSDKSQDECKNKGGKCLEERQGEYTKSYPKWQCSSNSCYIKPENIASYLDYIQGTGGADTGEGKVLLGDDEGFHSGLKYAITFVSPGKEWDIDTILALGGAAGIFHVAGVTLTAVGVIITAPIALAGAAVGTVATAYLTSRYTGSITDVNYIMVSKYDTIKERCAVQS